MNPRLALSLPALTGCVGVGAAPAFEHGVIAAADGVLIHGINNSPPSDGHGFLTDFAGNRRYADFDAVLLPHAAH